MAAIPELADAFLELLEKSKLLPADQMESVVKKYALRDMPSPTELADTLVDQNLITRFQADRLLEGRYRGFFIENYRAIEILGTGGMGWLYIAEDIETGNVVAVKMLPKKFETDPGMVARFKLEARAGMMLNHPNILRTYRIDRTGGIYGDVFYVVMEFVAGINLEELIILRGPVGWPQACDFIRQAAAGLHHAHQRGLVHRDVKPSNLLVDRHGVVKVLDFGLSRYDKEGDEFSLSMIFGHDCLGTADYISPEQSLDSYSVDARSDIYSLGCTLYVALTGTLPYPVKSTSEKLEGHRTKKPRPLRKLVPDVPKEVVAIVEKMMAKTRENRFATIREVCLALSPFARRQLPSFDFQAVLAARAALVKKKLAAQKKRSQKIEDAGSSAGGSKSGQSSVETAIRKDTQP